MYIDREVNTVPSMYLWMVSLDYVRTDFCGDKGVILYTLVYVTFSTYSDVIWVKMDNMLSWRHNVEKI